VKRSDNTPRHWGTRFSIPWPAFLVTGIVASIYGVDALEDPRSHLSFVLGAGGMSLISLFGTVLQMRKRSTAVPAFMLAGLFAFLSLSVVARALQKESGISSGVVLAGVTSFTAVAVYVVMMAVREGKSLRSGNRRTG